MDPMTTWIALFRGINVGGRNVIRMADLKNSFRAHGFANVRTYIQSGNVVFESKSRSRQSTSKVIVDGIRKDFGVDAPVVILAPADVRSAIERNPFRSDAVDAKTLHYFFLTASVSDADFDSLERAKRDSERFGLVDSVFYVHAPDGMAKSKLATKVESCLGVSATARNQRTVERMLALVESG